MIFESRNLVIKGKGARVELETSLSLWPFSTGGILLLWELENVKESKKHPKTYTYWMASWREDGRMRDVYLGSTRKMDAEDSMQKAREMKAEALGLDASKQTEARRGRI